MPANKTLPALAAPLHGIRSKPNLNQILPWLGALCVTIIICGSVAWFFSQSQQQLRAQVQAKQDTIMDLTTVQNLLNQDKTNLTVELASVSGQYQELAAIDQKVRNDELQATISAIEATYDQTVETYEELIKLREQNINTTKLDQQLTKIIAQLRDQNYTSASGELKILNASIQTERQKLAQAAVPTIPASVPQSNEAPSSGYSRQNVSTPVGNFLVSMVAADLGSTRVIVDTASGGDCHNDCPALPLADYVSRNGAYAGVNGSYFCPADYPSCAGKTNSFDTLLMNKSKVYFNSENNVYSSVPAVIFGGGYIRFVGASSEWGRDTGIDSMIANHPLLLSGGNITFGGDSDPKKGSRAGRSFVANKGNIVYIGVVHSSTVVEAAHALKTLGMEGALNLDSGGSTAFWSGGYKVGPGRNIPNAILFVRK